ncbi:hypothetical protein [Burkholderia glumae]|uniref:hypothetical protein n=1 Tax=Burkholderia glumae TaxID=337 RepID=UPI00039FAC30|nr:hypothetical protein [Burkholderia glumae]MCR1769028.1 hypothetical protein [Burkholderia glumae]QKM48020.1 hypothetical protein B7760_02054 [Burkholderia glumae]
MNQLDILELAAKAAGWESRRYTVRDLTVLHVRAHRDDAWRHFDSFASAGDALELAAAARIDMHHGGDFAGAYAGTGAFRQFSHDDISDSSDYRNPHGERMRAMRRALTECAAKIGRDIGEPWWRTL